MVRPLVHRQARSGQPGALSRTDRSQDRSPPIQRWLNRILALPIALQNAIFDEFMGLVEARIDAARQAGTLDLGLETIAVEEFTILSDTLLRTDPASGATTHLLELEIARALKPLTLKRLEEASPGSGNGRFEMPAQAGLPCSCPPAACLPMTARACPASNCYAH